MDRNRQAGTPHGKRKNAEGAGFRRFLVTRVAVLFAPDVRAPRLGLETAPQNAGKTPISQTGGAKSGAFSPDFEQIDPDLQSILDAWPTLPEALRTGILVMIDSYLHDAEHRRRDTKQPHNKK